MIPDTEFVLLFANGIIDDLAWVNPYIARARAVIAVDGGIRHVMAAGHLPDLLIGDLDSLPDGVEEAMTDWDVVVLRHPPVKDETDLELALLEAVRRFPEATLLVLGAYGGRLDHTLANILLLAHPTLIDRPISFVNDKESARLVVGDAVISGRMGDTVSLIPMGGDVEVRETTGLRWPLTDETLTFGPARGMSNEMTAERATIQLESGLLLCIHTGQ